MEEKNPIVPTQPVSDVQASVAPSSLPQSASVASVSEAQTQPVQASGMNPALKWIGITIGVLIGLIMLVLIGVYIYGYMSESRKIAAAEKSVVISPTKSEYTDEEITDILFAGDDKEEVRKVADFLIARSTPEDAFQLYTVAIQLFTLGNKEQAAFWYYIAQIRTGSYVASDPSALDQSADSFRKVIEAQFGPSIIQWVVSDVVAWSTLISRAISYEKKLPYPAKPEYVATDVEWKKIVDAERTSFEAKFLKSGLSDPEERAGFEAQLKAKGMYIGPWKDPGEPLLTEWQ